MWSPLNGDALYFVPAARSLVEGNGLRNPLWQPTLPAEPQDASRLNWHGPIAPSVWALFSKDASYMEVKKAGVKVAALGLFLMAAGIVSQVLRSRESSWLQVLLAFFAVLGSGWLFMPNGRPESVAALLVSGDDALDAALSFMAVDSVGGARPRHPGGDRSGGGHAASTGGHAVSGAARS
jgi:hypothetical protein